MTQPNRTQVDNRTAEVLFQGHLFYTYLYRWRQMRHGQLGGY